MEYKKEFDKWNNIKKKINDRRGDEFLRPVYILQKLNSKTFIGQVKLYDKQRLHNIIGTTSEYVHERIKKATVALISS